MICLVLLLFVPFVVHAQDATTGVPVVLVQPDSVTVKEGDVFNVTVAIENLPADRGMAGAQFQLTWNSSILNALSMDEVLYHEITPQNEWDNIWQIQKTFNNTIGIASYACLWLDMHRAIDGGYCPVNGIAGNHTLAIITMKAVETGSTILQLPNVVVADMNATALIDVGKPIAMDSSGNVDPPQQPTPIPRNDSAPLANLTLPTTGVPVVLVQPDSVTVKEGDVFNVTVAIENLPADRGMAGAQFQLTWNSSILNALSMDEVLYHEITPQNEWDNIWQIQKTFNNTIGIASYACLWLDMHRAIDGGYCPVNGIAGNHTLAIITMKAVETGSTIVNLQEVKVADMNATALIDFGDALDIDSSGNYYPRSQPTPMPENGSTTGNWTVYTVNPDGVLMQPQIASSQGNVTAIKKQDAPEVTNVPFMMLAMMSGMFIALPACWRRVRKETPKTEHSK